jgi:hypothetical protein
MYNEAAHLNKTPQNTTNTAVLVFHLNQGSMWNEAGVL